MIAISNVLFSQTGTLFGTKASNLPASSAELEVYSTSKGVLLPRVTSASVISSPAVGLLVYDKTEKSYAYFDGASWIYFPAKRDSLLIDTNKDTRVDVEKTSDEDKIQFTTIGVNTATMDYTGLNMKTNLPLSITNERVITSDANSVYIGKNAGGSAPSSTYSVYSGIDAGLTTSSASDNVVVGYNAASGNNFSTSVILGAGTGLVNKSSNVMVGYNTGILTTTGQNNLFLGSDVGNTHISGSNNILIGNNAGNGLATGSGNIVIGAGITLAAAATDSLKIGKILNAGTLIKFNNAYSFPNTVGTQKQILVVDNVAAGTLKWDNSSASSVDQTVLGSAAGMYSFDIGAKTNSDVQAMQRQMFFVPIVPSANATISQLMTWKKTSTGSDVTFQMALYGATGVLLSQTTAATVTASPKTQFVSQVLNTAITVEKGKTYYIGIRAGDLTNTAWTDFAGSALQGEYYYVDIDSNPANTNGISYNLSFPSDMFHPGSGYSTSKMSATSVMPWVRAF